MSIGDVLEVDVTDIQKYVENQISGKKPDNNKPVSPVQSSDSFIVSQADYIDYQIYKRSQYKKTILWHNTRDSLKWLIKCFIALFVGIGLCYFFYIASWFIQNSLYFHIQQSPN